jgi:hypothetical protein
MHINCKSLFLRAMLWVHLHSMETISAPVNSHGVLKRSCCDTDSGREPHCKDTIPKIWNKYSQKRNCVVTVPIPIFMFLWAIYIFPRSICLFCCRKIGRRSWKYIDRSQTHECENWDWGWAIPFLGIHKSKFLCSAFEPFSSMRILILVCQDLSWHL